MQTAITNQVMYHLGWKGKIGRAIYEIVEVKLRTLTLKKAVKVK